jgi:hypothetical protein
MTLEFVQNAGIQLARIAPIPVRTFQLQFDGIQSQRAHFPNLEKVDVIKFAEKRKPMDDKWHINGNM